LCCIHTAGWLGDVSLLAAYRVLVLAADLPLLSGPGTATVNLDGI
jgi:hypothetical protein